MSRPDEEGQGEGPRIRTRGHRTEGGHRGPGAAGAAGQAGGRPRSETCGGCGSSGASRAGGRRAQDPRGARGREGSRGISEGGGVSQAQARTPPRAIAGVLSRPLRLQALNSRGSVHAGQVADRRLKRRARSLPRVSRGLNAVEDTAFDPASIDLPLFSRPLANLWSRVAVILYEGMPTSLAAGISE